MEELEKLQKRLYKPGESFEKRKRAPELTPLREKARIYWKEEGEKPSPPKFPLFRSLVIFLAVLIVILGGLFWYLFVKGPSFSPKNIVFDIAYPKEVKVGDLAKFEINLENKNEIPVAWLDIIFQYPKNAKPAAEEAKKTLRERKKMGTIGQGEKIKESFGAYIFGEVDKEYEFKVSLEFRFEGSNIISEKETTGRIKIVKSPIGINIEGPEEINSGQAVKIKINFLSDSSALFENLIMQAEYPSGFEFKKAAPFPVSRNEKWSIGDFKPGEQRSVILEGILKGANLEEKYFKFTIGETQNGELNIFAEALKKIIVKRGFLETAISVDDKDEVVSAGQIVRGEIKYKNNLTVGVENVKIELEIFGKAADERGILAFQGYYLGGEKKIVWQEGSFPALRYLEPGEEGKVSFQFKILDKLPIASPKDKNFTIELKAKIFALKPPPDYQDVDLSFESVSSFKVESAPVLSRQGFYYSKDLQNSGPIPPRVAKKTTYTLVFSLTNGPNDIADLEIRSFLPAYISWENRILPEEENIEYDAKTNEVIWKIPRLDSGAGVIKPAKKVSFQIGLTPSLPQINTSPVILGETFMRGMDEFIGKAIEEKKPALTTELRDDAKLNYGDWQVKE